MKNIIFDLGSVILKNKPFSFLKNLDVNIDDYNELLRFFRNWDKLNLGEETLEEKYNECEFPKRLDKYKEKLINYYRYREINMNLVKLVKDLKSSGYNLYVLSNNNKEAIAYYMKYNLLNMFDGWVASCECHLLKKDLAIYKVLLDKYNLNPEECYFIDDKIENINCAKKCGIRGYVFDESKDISLLIDDMIKNNIHINKSKRENRNISLYIPKIEDYWYQEKVQNDPLTMSYNKGYDVSYYGYHYDTGCIDFPKTRWEDMYNKRTNENRYFAYIKDNDINEFVGYAHYQYNEMDNRYECGLLIEFKYRSQGYSKQALKLLCADAKKSGIKELYDNFETDREDAINLFLSVGFEIVEKQNWNKFGKEQDGVLLKIKL